MHSARIIANLIGTAHSLSFEIPSVQPDNKGTGWATFQAYHEEYPDIFRNTWQACVVVTFFPQTGCGQPYYALAISFASYLDPNSPFPLPCTMKQKALSFLCPTW